MYKSQYRGTRGQWLDASLDLTRAEAEQKIAESPHKYVGANATHRIVRVTVEVMKIGIILKGSE